MKEYLFDERLYRRYKGQELLRGDIVKADVYFTEGKDIRVCELLYPYKKDIWKALEIKGNKEILISNDMVIKILKDKWYHVRREKPEKYKYYWQCRNKR